MFWCLWTSSLKKKSALFEGPRAHFDHTPVITYLADCGLQSGMLLSTDNLYHWVKNNL